MLFHSSWFLSTSFTNVDFLTIIGFNLVNYLFIPLYFHLFFFCKGRKILLIVRVFFILFARLHPNDHGGPKGTIFLCSCVALWLSESEWENKRRKERRDKKTMEENEKGTRNKINEVDEDEKRSSVRIVWHASIREKKFYTCAGIRTVVAPLFCCILRCMFCISLLWLSIFSSIDVNRSLIVTTASCSRWFCCSFFFDLSLLFLFNCFPRCVISQRPTNFCANFNSKSRDKLVIPFMSRNSRHDLWGCRGP